MTPALGSKEGEAATFLPLLYRSRPGGLRRFLPNEAEAADDCSMAQSEYGEGRRRVGHEFAGVAGGVAFLNQ